MDIRITINTDNDAFDDGGGDLQTIREVTRILDAIHWDMIIPDGGKLALRDVNGNTVGKVEVTI